MRGFFVNLTNFDYNKQPRIKGHSLNNSWIVIIRRTRWRDIRESKIGNGKIFANDCHKYLSTICKSNEIQTLIDRGYIWSWSKIKIWKTEVPNTMNIVFRIGRTGTMNQSWRRICNPLKWVTCWWSSGRKRTKTRWVNLITRILFCSIYFKRMKP